MIDRLSIVGAPCRNDATDLGVLAPERSGAYSTYSLVSPFSDAKTRPQPANADQRNFSPRWNTNIELWRSPIERWNSSIERDCASIEP
jgi:hypothetical protein